MLSLYTPTRHSSGSLQYYLIIIALDMVVVWIWRYADVSPNNALGVTHLPYLIQASLAYSVSEPPVVSVYSHPFIGHLYGLLFNHDLRMSPHSPFEPCIL